mmetsp:Transcript_151267/g.466570  ORF Transcript_151267/g.466570 Transcript_151267/m.466570 type:complete len:203 (+) Transcript_151267:326-934(+)
MTHGSSAPDDPVLDARGQHVREAVALHQRIPSAKYSLKDEGLAVTAVGPVHPREPGVLLCHDGVVPLPGPDAHRPPGACAPGGRAGAIRRLAVAGVPRPQRRGVAPWGRVEVEVIPGDAPLPAPLRPVLETLCRVHLLPQLLETGRHHGGLVHDDPLWAPLTLRAVTVAQKRHLHRHVDPEKLRGVACGTGCLDAAPEPARV